MKRDFKKHIEAAVLLSLGLLPLSWFREGCDALAGFDFAVYLDPIGVLKRSFYLWSDAMAGGYDTSHEVSSIPYYLLYAAPVYLGMQLYAAEKAVFSALFALQAISMRYMLLSLFAHLPAARHIGFTGGLLYAFSYPVMAHFGRGNMMALLAYGLLPVLIGLIYKGVNDSRGTRGYVLKAALLSLMIAAVKGHPADFMVLLMVAASFVIFLAAPSFKAASRAAAFSLRALAASILVNLWWVVPNALYIADFRLSKGDLSGEGFYDLGVVAYYSSGSTLLSTFRNKGLDLWFSDPADGLLNPALYNSPLMVAIGLALPAAAFGTLLFSRERQIRFFAVLGTAALFLSKGSHAPMGWLYEWMYMNLPGFFFFRAPYRVFSSLVTFATVPLLALGLGTILWRALRLKGEGAAPFSIGRGELSGAAAIAAVIVLAGAAALYAWPLLTGAHMRSDGTKRVPGVFHSIPAYYREAEAWLKGRGKLYFPYHVYDANTAWGYNGPDPAFELFSAPKIVSRPGGTVYVSYQRPIERLNGVFSSWEYGRMKDVLGFHGGATVMLNRDMSPWVLPSHGFNLYAAELLESGGFGKKTIGALDLYENDRAVPRMHAPLRRYLLSGDEASLPALSIFDLLERPFLIFARDAGGWEGLLRQIEGSDGIVYANSDEDDLVSEALHESHGAGGAGPLGAGEYVVFLKGEGNLSFDGACRLKGGSMDDGRGWKKMGVLEVPGGGCRAALKGDAQATIIPLGIFNSLKAALARKRGAEVRIFEGGGQFEARAGNKTALEAFSVPSARMEETRARVKGFGYRVLEGAGDVEEAGERVRVRAAGPLKAVLGWDYGDADLAEFNELRLGIGNGMNAELHIRTDNGAVGVVRLSPGDLLGGRADICKIAVERLGGVARPMLKRVIVRASYEGGGVYNFDRPVVAGSRKSLPHCPEGPVGFRVDGRVYRLKPCGSTVLSPSPGVHRADGEGKGKVVFISRGAQGKPGNDNSVGFTRLNPARYTVRFAPGTDKMVFNDSFDPGWTLHMNGKKYRPVKANGFANGFITDGRGGVGTLEYAPQRLYRISALASALALAGVAVYSKRRT